MTALTWSLVGILIRLWYKIQTILFAFVDDLM